jgi:hypothetical protein
VFWRWSSSGQGLDNLSGGRVPKLSTNLKEILSHAHDNTEEQNKALRVFHKLLLITLLLLLLLLLLNII